MCAWILRYLFGRNVRLHILNVFLQYFKTPTLDEIRDRIENYTGDFTRDQIFPVFV